MNILFGLSSLLIALCLGLFGSPEAAQAAPASRPVVHAPQRASAGAPGVGVIGAPGVRAQAAPASRPVGPAALRPKPLGEGQLMPLLQALQHRDPQHRIEAMRHLAAYQGRAQVVLVALAHALIDSNQVVRLLAGRQIIRWGPGALAYMRPGLGHSSAKVRWSAAYALSQIQPKTMPIRSVLLSLLRNTSFRARGAAILGLHDGRKVSERVWLALARHLAWDNFPINRIYCLQALVTHPARAVPLLLKSMASDKHPLVRRRAAELLVATKLSSPAIAAGLVKALTHEADEVVRLALLQGWGRLYQRKAANAAAMVPHLRELLGAKLWTLREAALVQVGQLGLHARPLVDGVRARLRDPRPEVQVAAQAVLRLLQDATKKSKGSKGAADPQPRARPETRPGAKPTSQPGQ